MNRWASRNPEAMDEIASLPPNQQNEALREAIPYDPDRIRDECRDNGHPIEGDSCRCGRRTA